MLPECLDDYLGEDNPLGFDGAQPAAAARPSYHPAVLLKIYIYGYLNQVQSSGRREREAWAAGFGEVCQLSSEGLAFSVRGEDHAS